MITVPSAELVSLLNSALAFVPESKDDPMRGVLIEWDGGALHASGYDVLSGCRVTWAPGEGREADGDSDTPVIHYGGEDDPWRAFVSFDDAKLLVKVFKLAAKFWWVPVSLKISRTGSRLIAERSAEHGKPEATVVVKTDHEQAMLFPDVAAFVGALLADPDRGQVSALLFAPYRLAAFGSVVTGETMRMAFGQSSVEGTTAATAVTMGTRAAGFIYPVTVQRAVAHERTGRSIRRATATTPAGDAPDADQ